MSLTAQQIANHQSLNPGDSANELPLFGSEIFPLIYESLNITCLKLDRQIDVETGRSLSYHLNQILNSIIFVYHSPYFYALTLPKYNYPFWSEWSDIIEQLLSNGKTEFAHCIVKVEVVDPPTDLLPYIIGELAFATIRRYSYKLNVPNITQGKVNLRRELLYWDETINESGIYKAALTLSLKTRFVLGMDLYGYYLNCQGLTPEQALLGISVRVPEGNSYAGTIVEIMENPSLSYRDTIAKLSHNAKVKNALLAAPSDEFIVGVSFENNNKVYHYGLTALVPCITEPICSKFGVEWGTLLTKTKISNTERSSLIINYKKQVEEILLDYGLHLGKSINSLNSNMFWIPDLPPEQVSLLFGRGVTQKSSQILKGLSQGGVYRRHDNFANIERPLKIVVLNLCGLNLDNFIQQLKQQLLNYKFKTIISNKEYNIKNSSDSFGSRVGVENAIAQIVSMAPDIVIVALPQTDRGSDDTAEGSYYHKIYDLLLRQRIASQMIYSDTLSKVSSYRYVLNQVVPGILAKLGNLPFVLEKPLSIADCFLGLDISRQKKDRLSGSINACASVRTYGKQGNFIGYKIEDALLQGEEIPLKVLERLLCLEEMVDKTVLIYRDGKFRGNEIPSLLERAKHLNTKLILVECCKSRIPRLYRIKDKQLLPPMRGLGLILHPNSGILVTTDVPTAVGLAMPLRLTCININHPSLIVPPIQEIFNTTLNLTLLHHGALKAPRLPMPVYGAHKTSKLRLRGVYPSSALTGDCQFWL